MLELFLAELRRYRRAAVLFAAASAVIDFLVFRSTNLLDNLYAMQAPWLAVFVLSAMALAAFQFGSYRAPARWLWLLHRPLPRAHIFLAIHLASALLIVLAVGLPMALALLATKAEHARVVDTRHAVAVLHLVLFCLLGWQAASYAMLARHRGAVVVLVLPVMLAGLYFASVYALIAPMLLSLLLLGGALFTVFRPERRSSAKQPTAIALAAAPVTLCTYFILIWGATIAFNIGFTATSMASPSRHVPGGLLESMLAASDNQLVLAELARSSDPRAPAWREQIKPGDERGFFLNMRRFPVRDQASNAGYSALYLDNANWVFSHNRMQFVAREHSRDPLMEAAIGPGGVGDAAAFALPAVSVSASKTEVFVYTPHTLYLLDRKTRSMRQLVTLAADETIASLPEVGDDSMDVITNRRFIDYAWPGAAGGLQERFSIALPGVLSDLGSVRTVKVADGHLVTFLFGQQQENGLTQSQVSTFHVSGKRIETVHQRTLTLDVGFLYTQKNFWISPSLFALFELPRLWLDSGKVLDAGYTTDAMTLMMPRPRSAWILALATLLASATMAGLWLRRQEVSARYTAAWIIACLVIGLPALFALIVLQARPAARRAPHAANAAQPA